MIQYIHIEENAKEPALNIPESAYDLVAMSALGVKPSS
jgi:hypothetical protein